jgi:hypothetical protein
VSDSARCGSGGFARREGGEPANDVRGHLVADQVASRRISHDEVNALLEDHVVVDLVEERNGTSSSDASVVARWSPWSPTTNRPLGRGSDPRGPGEIRTIEWVEAHAA